LYENESITNVMAIISANAMATRARMMSTSSTCPFAYLPLERGVKAEVHSILDPDASDQNRIFVLIFSSLLPTYK